MEWSALGHEPVREHDDRLSVDNCFELVRDHEHRALAEGRADCSLYERVSVVRSIFAVASSITSTELRRGMARARQRSSFLADSQMKCS